MSDCLYRMRAVFPLRLRVEHFLVSSSVWWWPASPSFLGRITPVSPSSSLCLHRHVALPVCLTPHCLLPSSCKDASLLGERPTLLQYDLFLTNYICKDCVSREGHILLEALGIGLQHVFWGDIIQPHNNMSELEPNFPSCLPTKASL